MRIAVLCERAPGERRVAMVPDVGQRLIAAGHEVVLETGAGQAAFLADERYLQAGVQVASSAEAALEGADVVARVQVPGQDEIARLPRGCALVSFYQPLADPELARSLAGAGVTAFALDLLPRISRAQAMDALSSQATVSGYRSALMAAEALPRFFPMLMTAAGTVPPARVLVLGAGVAGLQAIATARRLGAVVRAHDVRPAAAEEVRSLGAAFVELAIESQEGEGGYARVQSEEFLARQRELVATEVTQAVAVITTAAVPGRPAPRLVSTAMVEAMQPGSVVVDLAAETGGNCELSVPGEVVWHGGVAIVGCANVPSQMPLHASSLYARNVAEFVALLARGEDGAFALEDEILAATCVTAAGVVRHAPTAELLAGASR